MNIKEISTTNNDTWIYDNFIITTEKSALQIQRIHHFLTNDAYWCQGISIHAVTKAIENSVCFGLFEIVESKKNQVGFARIVTDFSTFAWICDVYIENEYRGRGLSKWLMQVIMNSSYTKNLRRVCLATKDAHELYKKFGFEVTNTPGNWMEIKDNNIYKKNQKCEVI